jgi:hypothetical protein
MTVFTVVVIFIVVFGIILGITGNLGGNKEDIEERSKAWGYFGSDPLSPWDKDDG